MFFLLRCIVFLGLVFWAIPPHKSAGGIGVHEAGLRARTLVAAGDIRSSVGDFCASNPSTCMTVLSKLAASGRTMADADALQLLRAHLPGQIAARGLGHVEPAAGAPTAR